MAYEARGTIHHIGETQQKSERFTRRSLVLLIADNPKYPQFVETQVTGDRCAQLDTFGEGDEVRVEFSLRGREWRGPNGVKWFTTLDVFRIERVGAAQSKSTPSAQQQRDEDDVLPF